MLAQFYKGKRVLVTGHTGFKGGWLSLWLAELGAKVFGVSLEPPTNPNFHEIIKDSAFQRETVCDIRDLAKLSAAVGEAQPEVVFHLAAQPLVRHSYDEPLETIQTNVLGTANLLETIRQLELPCPVVVVTSDKCYENREWEFAYRENDPMGGHDVYSMSKGATELVAAAYYKSFFQPNPNLGAVATVRAGNVVGGGDYAGDRLVPDCVKALWANKPIRVRNPRSVRPWQHVLEPLSGYLQVGVELSRNGKDPRYATPFNFGPKAACRRSVQDLVEAILREWPGRWEHTGSPNDPHEARLLALATDKAGATLGWSPVWDFEQTVKQTISWYYARHHKAGEDMLALSRKQIEAYCSEARSRAIRWACG